VLQPSSLAPSFTHYLFCSVGQTALKLAIGHNRTDVAAYLIAEQPTRVFLFLDRRGLGSFGGGGGVVFDGVGVLVVVVFVLVLVLARLLVAGAAR
jgi:hypothetical protein